jgi:hypothetical protein
VKCPIWSRAGSLAVAVDGPEREAPLESLPRVPPLTELEPALTCSPTLLTTLPVVSAAVSTTLPVVSAAVSTTLPVVSAAVSTTLPVVSAAVSDVCACDQRHRRDGGSDDRQTEPQASQPRNPPFDVHITLPTGEVRLISPYPERRSPFEGCDEFSSPFSQGGSEPWSGMGRAAGRQGHTLSGRLSEADIELGFAIYPSLPPVHSCQSDHDPLTGCERPLRDNSRPGSVLR